MKNIHLTDQQVSRINSAANKFGLTPIKTPANQIDLAVMLVEYKKKTNLTMGEIRNILYRSPEEIANSAAQKLCLNRQKNDQRKISDVQ